MTMSSSYPLHVAQPSPTPPQVYALMAWSSGVPPPAYGHPHATYRLVHLHLSRGLAPPGQQKAPTRRQAQREPTSCLAQSCASHPLLCPPVTERRRTPRSQQSPAVAPASSTENNLQQGNLKILLPFPVVGRAYKMQHPNWIFCIVIPTISHTALESDILYCKPH